MKTQKMYLLATAMAVASGGQAFAQDFEGYRATLGVQTDSSVGRVGWAETATLALSTSSVPNAEKASRYYGRYWNYNGNNQNSAFGEVTVSSASEETFSISAAPLMAAGAYVIGDLQDIDADEVAEGAFVIAATAPRIDFVHEGTVFMDMKTRGAASAAGFGEALAFVDAEASQGASFDVSVLALGEDGLEVVPVFGGSSTATSTLFGAIEDPDEESGLISAVSYGAQIVGSSGSKMKIDEVTVSQTVTASVGDGIGGVLGGIGPQGPSDLFGSDFTFSRTADDLTLEGKIRGNGLSMLQEVERAAIAGGGVRRAVSLFETDEAKPE
jgi:hypothetical protein